jgi:hypothetical protein
MLVTLLILVALMLAGASIGKPLGWVVIGLAVLALLVTLGAGHLHL